GRCCLCFDGLWPGHYLSCHEHGHDGADTTTFHGPCAEHVLLRWNTFAGAAIVFGGRGCAEKSDCWIFGHRARVRDRVRYRYVAGADAAADGSHIIRQAGYSEVSRICQRDQASGAQLIELANGLSQTSPEQPQFCARIMSTQTKN